MTTKHGWGSVAFEDSQRPSTTSSHPALLNLNGDHTDKFKQHTRSELPYNSKIHQAQVQMYEIEF